MLLNLHVKNLAVIDEIEVDFKPGLNILTGETGAGKSVIIDSINIAAGGRIPKGLIRDGEQEALIELVFAVDSHEKKDLKTLGLVPEDDDLVVITRKISEKRTINRINGETCPASRLREVCARLIDVHGQNDNQSLLIPAEQRKLLDLYAGEETEPVLSELSKAYDEYLSIRRELKSDTMTPEERSREISFLQFEIDEIEGAHLKEGEEDKLSEELKKLSNARNIGEALENARRFTGGGLESASDLIGNAMAELRNAVKYDTDLQRFSDELSQADSILNDFNRELSDYLDDFSIDEEKLSETEDRLQKVRNIKAKYGSSLSEIKDFLKEAKEKLKKYENSDAHAEELHNKLDSLKEIIKNDSVVLHDIRCRVSPKLDRAIENELKELNFPEVHFKTDIKNSGSFTHTGSDDVSFMISLNPGMAIKPLKDAASGGELSRIMLALKNVFADEDSISSLIFDEIDTGISGRTAQKVAEKMAGIAGRHQVIVITHLAQIAAMADHHYLIRKSVYDEDGIKTTRTTITELKPDEEIAELARISGGVSITDTVLESAREMKAMADKYKKS
ncbi:MAG: DNA repair protein RecN [Lachnospiraceae bacterium]|nr:DNA repair protein RecN [Lachnospiraceae bacterium]MEE3460999.1 DNA repair protein RecN [Lachnospiraceae bacterium]